MYFKNPIKVFLFFVFFVIFGGPITNAAAKDVKAPDFTLLNLSGKSVSLNQYIGKVVILDFWATWCSPCRMSIPELVKIQVALLEGKP